VRYATGSIADAELLIVAYGTAARVARTAIERVREGGLRAGLFRPITLWPYPSEALARIAPSMRGILVVELSAGQMIEDVRLAVLGAAPISFIGRMGGVVPSPGEVVDALRHLYATTAPGPIGTAVVDGPDPLDLVLGPDVPPGPRMVEEAER
jgi:2-oxoglutarate ferredoxin oxidoreductase subunit alpha